MNKMKRINFLYVIAPIIGVILIEVGYIGIVPYNWIFNTSVYFLGLILCLLTLVVWFINKTKRRNM
jgi:hypothetical protein